MARLFCLVVCFFISLGFEACVSGSNEIFIRFEQESYEVNEGDGILNISLVLVNGTILRPFDVSIEFMDGTAHEFEDFLSDLSTTIASFGMGATESSIVTVGITEDYLIEGNEDFTVRGVLDADTEARVEILPPNPRVTIIDDDLLTVRLTENAVTVTEGTDDVVKVTVKADILSDFPFHVFINLMDVTAKSGTDFVGDRIRVDFAPFQTSVDVSIPLIDDNTAEKREWFKAKLEVPPEFTIKGIATGGIVRTRVTIVDDDCVNVTMNKDTVTATAEILIRFEQESYEVCEGDGFFNISLVLVNGTILRPFDVSIVFMDGTAHDIEDFISNLFTTIASFGVGATQSSVVTVLIAEDKRVEKCEYFTVRGVLDADTAARVEILPPNPRVTIIDNDSPLVSFVESNVTGGEGDVVKLRVKRTGSITEKLKCKVCIESTTAKKGVNLCMKTKSVVFKKLNAESEVRTVRVKLLSGNTNCFHVVLKCKCLIGCSEPSATVCIQGN